ncbi:MAG: hypothetical protein ACK59C_00355 [Holosporales bacterium]
MHRRGAPLFFLRVIMVRYFLLLVFCMLAVSTAMAEDIPLPLGTGVTYDGGSPLDNPLLSEPARIKALQKNQGRNRNMAVIIQKGTANKSVVRQSGDKNTAVQEQQDFENDLVVDQEGNDNSSEERQDVVHNTKVKIQRSRETSPGVLIEQVQP